MSTFEKTENGHPLDPEEPVRGALEGEGGRGGGLRRVVGGLMITAFLFVWTGTHVRKPRATTQGVVRND